jgi:hypothetical protein
MRSKAGPPMTLANMRQNGVRSVTAPCEACLGRRQCRRPARDRLRASRRPAPAMQQLRRQGDIDPARLDGPRRMGPRAARVLGWINDSAPAGVVFPCWDRLLQTGTGTAQRTAISSAAVTAVIFSLVERSMASSDALPTSAPPFTRPLVLTV